MSAISTIAGYWQLWAIRHRVAPTAETAYKRAFYRAQVEALLGQIRPADGV